MSEPRERSARSARIGPGHKRLNRLSGTVPIFVSAKMGLSPLGRVLTAMDINPTSDVRLPRLPSTGPLLAVADWIADLGGLVMDWIVGLGNISMFSLRTFGWMLSRLPRKETLLPSFYQIGVLSLPVIALTGTFIGMVLVVQSYVQFRNLHLEAKLGAVINMSLVRELGPGAGRHDVGRPRGQRHGRRTGHHARHRADRRPDHHGRQSDPLPGRAAVPRLPAADSGADDHGRLHGRGRGRSSTP